MEEIQSPNGEVEIVLARPRGFCAGVERAIAIVELALQKFGAPVYVKHAIVHNWHVVARLEKLGAVFVEELQDVPEGAHTIFSAHGVSPAVREEARGRDLQVVDATCPLVTKVHVEAKRFASQGRTIFLIGHREHVEVIGTLGEAPQRIEVIGTVEEAKRITVVDPGKVSYLTQTTLSLDDTRVIVEVLQRRFPALTSPGKEDICYATQNRQNAVQALAKTADLILVVGSQHSSNSNRLAEVARARGVPAYLVESHAEVKGEWLAGARCIGVTAGASAPEEIVQELVSRLAGQFNARIREIDVAPENVSFPLPAQLSQ
ncbi:MAG: 4-hydroxy-3-methylbut-2-enyl diphosphate reductase [SAR324 cluster bacterium]|nr:4-hydroxy-3-methylbut-2-enyl diphosphate reductase [SAR324 cluster bacterium]MCZ6645351.1 4-hydroxy-3-methylbut-2-enyl diphosphate reductase [SAR324 cluster bacterium]